MAEYRRYSFSLAIGAVAVVLLWAAVVPTWISRTTFGGMVAIAFALAVVTLMSLRAGRSTRSVAHVIHDAETEVDAGPRARRTGGR